MNIENLLDWFELYIGDDTLVLQVFSIVFLSLLADFFQKRIVNRIHAGFSKTATLWDDAAIDAIRKPLSFFIWLVGISYAAQLLGLQLAALIRDIGIIVLVTWALTRFVRFVEKKILHEGEVKGKPIDRTTADAVTQLLRISIMITATLVILQTLGIDISAILAFGGIGGVAVGFASKDLLANFFGAIMIYLDRPFSIGDWVRSSDRNIEGTVEKIGWRLTVIRTFDKRPLYVPNSIFTSITVENPSRMTNRRIYETIGVRYDDAAALPAIIEDVKQMLQQHAEIDQQQTMMVNFNQFAESSLDFFVYTFTKTTDWQKYHEIKQDVLLKINSIIERHGAAVAFPTTTLELPENITIKQT